MASMKISVPEPMRDWVQHRVATGSYLSPADYATDLIQRDQAGAGRRDAIIAALIEGEQSGTSDRNVLDIWKAVTRERRSSGCLTIVSREPLISISRKSHDIRSSFGDMLALKNTSGTLTGH